MRMREPMSSPEATVTINKLGDPNQIYLGQRITYTIPFANESDTESAGLLLYQGDYVNNPLVISDTIPAGANYVTGTASYSLSFTQWTCPGCSKHRRRRGACPA